MRAFALSLSGNHATADDLVQDTVVKAWSNFDKFQPGTNLRAWLFTILRNTFYSQFRRRQHEVEDPMGRVAGHLSEKNRCMTDGLPSGISAWRSGNWRLNSARHWFLSVSKDFPTKRRPKCATAPWARSKAASAAPAGPWPT